MTKSQQCVSFSQTQVYCFMLRQCLVHTHTHTHTHNNTHMNATGNQSASNCF